VSSSRYIDRSFETDRDDNGLDLAYGVRANRPIDLQQFLRHLILLDADDDDYIDDELMASKRRTKSITKGDPREFMG
jgi:hypothetical protein